MFGWQIRDECEVIYEMFHILNCEMQFHILNCEMHYRRFRHVEIVVVFWVILWPTTPCGCLTIFKKTRLNRLAFLFTDSLVYFICTVEPLLSGLVGTTGNSPDN